jgi:hypothetical protein
LIQEFRGLCAEFEAVKDFDEQEKGKRLKDLDAEFVRLVKTAQATPSSGNYKKADKSA